MVNTEKFTKRLHKILDYYDLSAASFADQIDVGRSSISHILSGRNKPSLDFVMKVVQNFPEVELYWLLNGKGKFPKNEQENAGLDFPAHEAPAPSSPSGEPTERKIVHPQQKASSASGKEISKIVIFYSDGSFEAFEK